MATRRLPRHYVRSFRPMGEGNLTVYAEYLRERPTNINRRLFTYNSLSEVLGIRQSILNNRYVKCNMAAVMEMIPNDYTRPVRGFDITLLETIISMASTGEGSFDSDETPKSGPRYINSNGDDTVTVGDQHYITVQSLMDFYGRSRATVYKRLHEAGLSDYMMALPMQDRSIGRPQRGLPLAYREAAQLAIEEQFTAFELRARGLIPDDSEGDLLPLAQVISQAQRHGYRMEPMDPTDNFAQPFTPSEPVNTVNPDTSEPDNEPDPDAPVTSAEDPMAHLNAWAAKIQAKYDTPKVDPLEDVDFSWMNELGQPRQ